jgi:hypothetical protein
MCALLINVSWKLLNLEVVEALVHKQVDTDYLIELIDSKTTNRLKDPKEDHWKDWAPGNDTETTQELSFNHLETSRVYQTQVFVKNANCKTAPGAWETKDLEAADRVVDLVPVEELAGSHWSARSDSTNGCGRANPNVVTRGRYWDKTSKNGVENALWVLHAHSVMHSELKVVDKSIGHACSRSGNHSVCRNDLGDRFMIKLYDIVASSASHE